MDPSTLILTLVLGFLLAYRYLWKPTNRFKELNVPHKTPIPIIGNMAPTLFRKVSMHECLQDLYHRFPNVKYFGVYHFVTPVIAIKDPDLITSIAVKNFDNFTDHVSIVDEKMDPLVGNGLFFLRGDAWREMRKILSPSFTASKLKAMFHLINDCADKFTRFVADDAKQSGRSYEMKEIFGRYTNDVVASCNFGFVTDSMRDPGNEFYTFAKRTMNFLSSLSLRLILGNNFPALFKLLRIQMFDNSVRQYFVNVVDNVVKARKENSGSSSNNGAGGINLGPVVGGRRLPSQQSFHSSKNNHSHHSRHQTTSAPPSTPRNACQLPEIGTRCIHIRSSSRNLVSTRNQQSITKMLLLISTVFILLNLPSYVIRLCVFFFTLARKNTPDLLWCLQQFFMLLYYTNFSINFLLYAMCGITFRRCLQQLLRKVLKSMTRYHCNPQGYI